ncbi:hypothetical protein FB45DRAFT_835856 [Roridomyces roridus]|uniref:Uncharacterized protein n=1 Tax=Roridomyces roridus TaxID=1738132 RepID=A0AAD7FL90_9AGAR|nr:hypothetical protein FB45DRAFT_835856 [Roridomyces roridus]
MHLSSFAIFAAFLVTGQAYPYVPSDIHCPSGSHHGFLHNSYTYLAPLHKFTAITGSFFNVTWYANTIVNATTGMDNVPGATRSGPASAETSFHETLTAFTSYPGDMLEYTYHGAATSDNGVDLEGYAETLRFRSICGGKATYMDIVTYFCSRQRIAAYDIFYQGHLVSFPGIATEIGAPVFEGDCPGV